MEINRQTYESFFLLYVDNELSAEQRQELEQFLEENPDLKPELEMLMDTVLVPDEEVGFGDKERLLRISTPNPVNDQNYEEYFVQYGDDELYNAEKEFTELFVYKNPQYQAEFELILSARISPDPALVFPDKNSLYRSEKDSRVIGMNWWKIAAAAVLILAFGSIGWYYSSGDGQVDNGGIVQQQKPTANEEGPGKTRLPAPEEINSRNSNDQLASGNDVKKPVKNSSSIHLNAEPEFENQSLAKADKKDEKKSEEESNKAVRLYVEQSISREMAINTDKIPEVKEAVSDEKILESIQASVIKNEDLASVEPMKPAAMDPEQDNSPVIYIANTELGRKSKLRGFFRTASRVFEKTANIQPSGRDKGIRIANFEIELK